MFPDLAMLYAMYILKEPDRYKIEGVPPLIREEVKTILGSAVKTGENAK